MSSTIGLAGAAHHKKAEIYWVKQRVEKVGKNLGIFEKFFEVEVVVRFNCGGFPCDTEVLIVVDGEFHPIQISFSQPPAEAM